MSKAQDTGPVLSLPVAAVRLGLSYQTTYRLAVGGKLGKPRHRRGRWYVPEKAVEGYKRDNTFEVAEL